MSNKNMEFKDSQIAWIGQIPKHWKISKIKYVAKLKTGGTPSNSFGINVENNGYPWITPANIDENFNIKADKFITEKSLKISNFSLFYSNTILLIGIGATVGKIGYLLEKSYCNQQITALVPFNINSKFLLYYLHFIKHKIILEASTNTLPIINNKILNNISVIYPPLNEQKKIAEFLDKKCEIIDKRLNNLERKIKSLKEYKKSLISECVTKGLNPKNMEFKDSQIPWIGQIPKHWEVTKIKMYYKVILGKMLANNPSSIDDTLENYLSAINIKFEGVNTSEQKQMFFNKREKELYLLKQGDVLISEGGDAGTACVYNNEFYPCYIQNAVHKVITKNSKKAINKFLYYWIFFIKSVGYVNLICNKATLMHFTKEKVENNFIFLPPLNEQKEIAEFLDKKCEKIDRLNENYTKQITALKEYKKSLIYECVTGKKEI